MDSTNEQNTQGQESQGQESQALATRPNYYLPSNSSKSKRVRSKHHRSRHRSLKSSLGLSKSRRRHRHHRHHHHRSHRVRNTVLVLLLVLIVAAGACGGALYFSARNVLAHVRAVRTEAATLQKGLFADDEATMRTSSKNIAAEAAAIQKEMNGPVWNVASYLPFIGTDVRNVRVLSDCASNLSNNVLEPLIDQTASAKLSNLVQESVVDTKVLRSIRGAVVEVAPDYVENARAIAELPHGQIQQLNEVLDDLRMPLSTTADILDDADGTFDAILRILGDGGVTRHYVILAQQNSEIRTSGGFPGAVGTATVTDGKIELSDFVSVADVKGKVKTGGFNARITNEELIAFGDVLANDAAGPTLTPNFVRAGEITREQWEFAYGEKVDGVIAADPLFVQRMLGIVGPITAEDGTVVSEENAAFELMYNSYLRYQDAKSGEKDEDDFFYDVADLAFHKMLDTLPDLDLIKFLNVFFKSGADRRFQVWLANDAEEQLMHTIGVSGDMDNDPAEPVLGVLANDNTWAKLTWFFDTVVDFGEPTTNADGTTSYPVTAHFKNTMDADDVASSPNILVGGKGANPLQRERGDLVETIYIMAPAGGTVTDYEVHQDAPIEKENQLQDERLKVYGFDTMRSRIQILPGGDTFVTFTLTLPAEAQGKLPEVRTSPLCHD